MLDSRSSSESSNETDAASNAGLKWAVRPPRDGIDDRSGFVAVCGWLGSLTAVGEVLRVGCSALGAICIENKLSNTSWQVVEMPLA